MRTLLQLQPCAAFLMLAQPICWHQLECIRPRQHRLHLRSVRLWCHAGRRMCWGLSTGDALRRWLGCHIEGAELDAAA